MKKLAIPLLCTLIGCAAGVATPALMAQTFGPAAPGVGQWDQFCEEGDLIGPRGGVSRVKRWGQHGFRLVSTHTVANGARVTACYTRPTSAQSAW